MKKLLIIGLVVVSAFIFTPKAFGAYSWYIPFTATSSAVAIPSTQTNFPVLISITSSTLKSTSSGGTIETVGGFDIAPFSDTGCTSQLSFERELYVSSTGQLVMWALQSTLSTSTVNYLCYGNSAQTTDLSSSTAVWDANYKGVWHMAQGNATTTPDSTVNANNVKFRGTVGATSTASQIGNGIVLAGQTNEYWSTDAAISFDNSVETFSTWINYNNSGARNTIFDLGAGQAGDSHEFGLCASISGNLCLDTGSYWFYSAVNSVPTSSWAYLTIVNPSSAFSDELIYINGATTSITQASGFAGGNATTTWFIGARSSVTQLYKGTVDETRISKVARSSSWIASEYSNQKNPTTFWTIGDQTAVGGGTPATTWGGIPVLKFVNAIVQVVNGIVKFL